MIQKINTEEIRTGEELEYIEVGGIPVANGTVDNTKDSLKLLADKINEIIEVMNEGHPKTMSAAYAECPRCSAKLNGNFHIC